MVFIYNGVPYSMKRMESCHLNYSWHLLFLWSLWDGISCGTTAIPFVILFGLSKKKLSEDCPISEMWGWGEVEWRGHMDVTC